MPAPCITQPPPRILPRLLRVALAGGLFLATAEAEIPQPTDAPEPLPPAESAAAFLLPDGFRMELVAAEPLIASPTGVCWDEHGRMFVSELHGYNLEGQLDIEALNKTGKLDTQVRRVQAAEKFKKAAEEGTYGVVKMLRDTDDDGLVDEAVVWADNLPPVYGIAPVTGGVIAACAPDIVLLADRDGDGKPEVRETLLSGFPTGALERGINAPMWGDDGWIYFGRGWGGGEINGPRLDEPVFLPNTDFRIRADGSAIEPVTGGTRTFGFAMTAAGDRFVVSTTVPAIAVAPLPWRYLARNPDVPTPNLETPTGARRVHQLAPTHPWRQKRADDPAYFKYYNQRYGAAESEAEGWFTAACGPMVYRDTALPGLHGCYFVCEPAGNLVHRAVIKPDGPLLTVHRAPEDAESEFAATRDAWSHPVALTHGPDGAIWVVDYYREIIEDYSAIPRHLQQQYGLDHGHDRGRIYRLTHRDRPAPPAADMSRLDQTALVRELASPLYWRRLTAQRILTETAGPDTADRIRALLEKPGLRADAIIAGLNTLEALDAPRPADLTPPLGNGSVAVKIHALRLGDRFLRTGDEAWIEAAVAAAGGETDPRVQIQLALSLGESSDSRAFAALADYARRHLGVRWMDAALLSSLHGRAGQMATELSRPPRADAGFIVRLKEAAANESPATSAIAATGGGEIPSKPPPASSVSEGTFRKYLAALGKRRNPARGHEVFTQTCAICHRIGGEGHAFGPDILGEAGTAEETLLRHLLLPNDRIRPGFETTVVKTKSGSAVAGLLTNDGPTSVTLALPAGLTHTTLRKDIEAVQRLPHSMMPGFAGVLTPAEIADLLAWLKSQLRANPPTDSNSR